MTQTKHTPQAAELAEAILKASGSSLKHYTMPSSREAILDAAQAGIVTAQAKLLAALQALTATTRTFRNVPQQEQQWTSLDDDSLDAAFAAIAEAEGRAA